MASTAAAYAAMEPALRMALALLRPISASRYCQKGLTLLRIWEGPQRVDEQWAKMPL